MNKQYTNFEINSQMYARCWYENTRSGFRHQAELIYKSEVIGYAKATYQNRTWESYTYESVLRSLLGKTESDLSQYHLGLFKKMVANGGRKEQKRVESQMKSTALIAGMGSIFGKDQKESNDWKARMLKAGMPGLTMPSDWETLPEDVKQDRLDKVINEIK